MDDSATAYGTQAALVRALDGLLGPRSESCLSGPAGGVAVLDRNDSDTADWADADWSTAELVDDLVGVDADCLMFDEFQRFDGIVGSWLAAPFTAGLVASWSADEARAGLAVLERVERSLAAVRSALVGRVGLNRDSAAMLTRGTGMSQRAAREAVRVAGVVAAAPVVGERLERGEVSAAQVGAVVGIDVADAVELLDVAAGQSDDEFAATVQRFRVEAGGRDRVERQRASRSVRFGEGPEGCVRMTAVLPPLEGAEVRGLLDRMCDAMWRRDHPERARVAGGHDAEPRDRRLADALVALLRGAGARAGLVPDGASKWAGSSGSNGPAGSDGLAGPASSGGPAGPASSAGSAPVVIVTVEAETLRTTLLPDTALDTSELPELLARSQLYVAIREGTNPARMVFGRNRRLASAMQRLALAVLQPRCTYPGCDVPAQRCEVHHDVEFDAGQAWPSGEHRDGVEPEVEQPIRRGSTDLANLRNLCSAHHHHHHDSAESDVTPWGDQNRESWQIH